MRVRESQREPERVRDSQRENQRESLWLSLLLSLWLTLALSLALSLALWLDLSLSVSLSLALSLSVSVSGYLWSMHFLLNGHFCCKYVKLFHFVPNCRKTLKYGIWFRAVHCKMKLRPVYTLSRKFYFSWQKFWLVHPGLNYSAETVWNLGRRRWRLNYGWKQLCLGILLHSLIWWLDCWICL